MLLQEPMNPSGSHVFKSTGSSTLCFKTKVITSPAKATVTISRTPPSVSLQNHESLSLGPLLTTLTSLRTQVTTIITEADYTKSSEVSFHSQSLSMSGAAAWWPLVHIGVLLVAGVAWVVNITAFFRKKKLV